MTWRHRLWEQKTNMGPWRPRNPNLFIGKKHNIIRSIHSHSAHVFCLSQMCVINALLCSGINGFNLLYSWHLHRSLSCLYRRETFLQYENSPENVWHTFDNVFQLVSHFSYNLTLNNIHKSCSIAIPSGTILLFPSNGPVLQKPLVALML